MFVFPMYMDGTFRTASSPSNIFMFSASYSLMLNPDRHHNVFIGFVTVSRKKNRTVRRWRADEYLFLVNVPHDLKHEANIKIHTHFFALIYGFYIFLGSPYLGFCLYHHLV